MLVAVALGILLCGCVSKEEYAVVNEIKHSLNAGSGNIKRNDVVLSLGDIQSTVELSFAGVDSSNTLSVDERLTSNSAYYFYNHVPHDKNNYNKIRISLEGNAGKVKDSYTIGALDTVAALFKDPIGRFFDLYKTKDVAIVIDTSQISDSSFVYFSHVMLAIDSLEGKLSGVTLRGFDFRHLNESNEPVIIYWIDAKNGKGINQYEIIVSPVSRKIVRQAVNHNRFI
jgi:hypothetical protein